MTPWLLGLFAFAPAAALLASYPKRPAGAAVVCALSALGAGACFILDWGAAPALAGAWAAATSGAVWLLVSQRKIQHAEAAGLLGDIRSEVEEAGRELGRLRARGTEVEREHRETMVFYALIKGLSEAISWDGIKPRLESAVDQYLGITDFGLYTATERGLKPLLIRRLDGSPGASWPTLGRYLQERGLTYEQAHFSEKPEAAVGLPIQHNGETLGYFYARAPKGVAPRALLGKAQGFVDDVAFAFRRLKLFQEVESLSTIDGLTGVHRRGEFDERLRHEIVRAKTFKTTLGVMMLDIDHFKRLNDRYGHPFGDQVLKRVGELLNASVYETDFVARYGGEEFVILLPRAEPEGALRKAELIRAALENERFTLALETIRVTTSIGVAQFPRDGATPEELLGQADAALYQAKHQGRNRVVSSDALRRGP